MPLTTIVGALWGDEGKGKIVDATNEEADLIVKANGGGNAGTSYVINGKKVILHLLPSGALRKKRSLMAQGMVMRARAVMQGNGRIQLGCQSWN